MEYDFDEDLIKEASEFESGISALQKSQETALWKKWKQTNDKGAFQELYKSMKPIMMKASQKASFNSNIPQSAHQAYAAQNFYDALRTYDPNKGALNTFVYGNVHQKAKRLNYLYQDLGHKPEPRAQKVGLYQTIKEQLRNDLGREPSSAEVADNMGIPVREVTTLERELTKDLAIDEITEQQAVYMTDASVEKLDYVYYDLNGEEQGVYDYIMGGHGKPRMVKANQTIDFDGIGNRMGISSSKVRMLHKKISDKLEKIAR